jgi:hypothetical protein
VNEPFDEGGGPAGVVEGFEAPNGKLLLPLFDFLSGVDGGLEEYGTWKAIVTWMLLRAGSESNGCAAMQKPGLEMAMYWYSSPWNCLEMSCRQ